MTAPDIDTLYMLEDHVEDAVKKVLGSYGFTALMQREAETVVAPYINVQLAVGRALNQIHLLGGKAYQKAWEGTLGIEIFTKRSKDSAGNGPTEHSRMRAKVRRIMQYGEKEFPESVMPYHVLTKVLENATRPEVQDSDGLDVSQVSFSVIVSIRNNAWPVPS